MRQPSYHSCPSRRKWMTCQTGFALRMWAGRRKVWRRCYGRWSRCCRKAAARPRWLMEAWRWWSGRVQQPAGSKRNLDSFLPNANLATLSLRVRSGGAATALRERRERAEAKIRRPAPRASARSPQRSPTDRNPCARGLRVPCPRLCVENICRINPGDRASVAVARRRDWLHRKDAAADDRDVELQRGEGVRARKLSGVFPCPLNPILLRPVTKSLRA